MVFVTTTSLPELADVTVVGDKRKSDPLSFTFGLYRVIFLSLIELLDRQPDKSIKEAINTINKLPLFDEQLILITPSYD
jgi:hypothetical protein